jgi:hypothetical protein
MHAGEYKRAASVFKKRAGRSRISSAEDAEWYLKEKMLTEVRRIVGFDKQERHISETMKSFDGVESNSTDIDDDCMIKSALQLDGLCGLAWFNRGVLQIKLGEKNQAFISFLISALVSRVDVEAWYNALLLAMELKQHVHLLGLIAMVAHSINGERFLREMHRIALAQPRGFPVDQFINNISQFLQHLPKKSRPVDIRLLGKEYSFETVTLGT